MVRFGLIVFLIFAVSILSAVPYTALGNINIPDAYVLPHLMFEVSYTNYFVQDPLAYEDEDFHYNMAGCMNFGILNRGEVGVVVGNNDLIYANLKVKIINETDKIPAIALGVDNCFSRLGNTEENMIEDELADRNDYIKNSPYFVLSKSTLLLTNFPFLEELETVFHLGLGARKFKGKGEIVRNAEGIFGGVDFRFSEPLGMNIEFDAQNINLGLNLFWKNFTLRAGVFEIEDIFDIKEEDSGNKYAINIKYTLDAFSEVKASEKESYQKQFAPQTYRKTTSIYPSTVTDTEQDALLEELRKITERRKEAEKELEEIRKLLEQE
ncbi:MAG: hypothetical protein JXB60_05620 [Candidatus Cloacimonetes bacterium]|nr:hypothetical protein [Candidatus Cloacimonadota bacterium]